MVGGFRGTFLMPVLGFVIIFVFTGLALNWCLEEKKIAPDERARHITTIYLYDTK